MVIEDFAKAVAVKSLLPYPCIMIVFGGATPIRVWRIETSDYFAEFARIEFCQRGIPTHLVLTTQIGETIEEPAL